MTYEEWFAKMAASRAIELNGPCNLDGVWYLLVAQVMCGVAWLLQKLEGWVIDR